MAFDLRNKRSTSLAMEPWFHTLMSENVSTTMQLFIIINYNKCSRCEKWKVPTRVELVTSGLLDQRSNQLSYGTVYTLQNILSNLVH